MNFFNLIFRECFWDSYYRIESQSIDTIIKNNNPWHKVTVSSNRYWCADPFIVEGKGKKYVFCELMDRKRSRGLLGYSELNEDGDTEIMFLMDVGCHVSYPNVFYYDNNWYMIPETSQRLTVELYKATNFPDKWIKIGNVIEGRKAVDTTVFFKNAMPFLFVYEPNGFDNKLSIAELDVSTCSISNERLLVNYSKKIGRPGGNVLVEKGKIFRVTQSGEKHYGEKLVFKSFKNLNLNYEEEDILDVNPSDFKIPNGCKYDGVHTYNKSGGYEIVDFRYYRFIPKRPIELFCKFFRLFGYTFNK